MRELVIDFGVPLGLFVLMAIVGTELTLGDLRRVVQHPRAVLLGVFGQLIVLPPAVLALTSGLPPFLAAALLLLSLCPGGAISNTYTYLARCNVSLSATITAIGTLCSLVSIPFWFALVSHITTFGTRIAVAPASTILTQLAVFMILPLCTGSLLRALWPDAVRRHADRLRWASLAILLAILVAAFWSVRQEIYAMAATIALSSTLFILVAMLLGFLLGRGLSPNDGPVLIIESAVRNVGIAAIMGRIMFTREDFGTFAGFLTGYFIIEILIMLPYAYLLRRRSRANS